MTEAEWLTCDDPERMLGVIWGKPSARRQYLVGLVWIGYPHRQLTPHLRAVADAVSELADARARAKDFRFPWEWADDEPEMEASYFDHLTDFEGPAEGLYRCSLLLDSHWREFRGRFEAERAFRCAVLREILGNPFRPVVFAPEWRTSTAIALAAQMYESRDFSPMPILADALQDAGCENEEVLNHCRGPGPHVRGCWVVDQVRSVG